MPSPLLCTTTLLLLAAGTPLCAAEVDIPLANAGFEDGWPVVAPTADSVNEKAKITGEVAKGWGDNSSWADVKVAYSAATTDPHRGKTAQRIHVARVASGAVQYVQAVPFAAGRVYAFSVWMRGRPGDTVSLLLRRQGAPYTQYAGTDATLSAEWREYTVEGVVPEEVDGMVMLRMSQAMDIQVDDARLTDISAAATDAPPHVGNLVAGGSFEAGMPFGWSTRIEGAPLWEWLDARPVVDTTVAHGGAASYRIDVPSGASASLRSPLIRPNVLRPHAASVWVKASHPDTHVRVELEKTGIARDVSVGTAWQRVDIAGTLPFQRWTRLRIWTRAPDGAEPDPTAVSLWVDGVQVEEAAQPSAEYRPAMPFEATLGLGRPGSIVFDGEAAAVALNVVPAPPAGATLRLAVVDAFGDSHAVEPVALPAASFPLPDFAKRPRGVFKLTGTVVDAAGAPLTAPVQLVWSRLPKPREIAPEQSYFGIHMPLAADYVAVARATGTRWVRLHDASMLTKWPITETAPGQWEFYDRSIDAAHQGGLAVLGMLDGAPRWTSTITREGYWGIWHLPDRPDAPAQWENYVRTIVGHYRGRVAAWEMWNEPWGEWWSGAGGTPELYGRLMKIAYTAAKQADPAATFVGVDSYRGHDRWHDGVLAEAGLGSFDAFSFHDYADSLYGGPESQARLQTDLFNRVQARHGTPKPLWNTEGGAMSVGSFYAPDTGGQAVRRQLAQAVRYDVTMMAAGVKMFCLYAIHADPAMGEIDCRVTEHDRAIKPILAARAVLASFVDGAGTPVRSEPVPGVDLHRYPIREKAIVALAWSHDGGAHALPVAAGVQVLDVLGNPLVVRAGSVVVDTEPVYLVMPAP